MDERDGIRVERADGQKCERCWKYSTTSARIAEYPDGVRRLRADSERDVPVKSAGGLPARSRLAWCVLDRVTKLYIQAAYSPRDVTRVIPGFFYIDHVENPGAGFRHARRFAERLARSHPGGRFAGGDGDYRGDAVASSVSQAHAGELMRVALALILGGAAGNLWDRVFRGTVTDFLQFFFGQYEFPSFNAADSMITIGAGLLLIDLWLTRHEQPAPRRQNPDLTT